MGNVFILQRSLLSIPLIQSFHSLVCAVLQNSEATFGMDTHQLFSVESSRYAVARPQYPDQLFDYLADLCEETDSVWDCATGSGQAAISLTKHFDSVQATDVSAAQIANAFAQERVYYSVQPAEKTNFETASFDLVTVATALHWFNLERFWPEVHRVL